MLLNQTRAINLCVKHKDVAKIEKAREALNKDFTQIFSNKEKKQRHQECYLSAQRAEKLLINNQATFVDVRNSSAYKDYRIHQSINIPIHVLKTKQYLKRKKIVLVDDGSTYQHLEQACIDLRNDGFKQTYILSGGLSLWGSQHGSLYGNRLGQHALQDITSEELFVEKNYSHFYVLDVSAKQSSKSANIPKNNLIFSSGDIDDIKQEIKNVSAVSHAGVPVTLIISDEDDSNYATMKHHLAEIKNINVFFLKEGWSGYKKFIGQQVAVWKRKLQRPLDQMKCGA